MSDPHAPEHPKASDSSADEILRPIHVKETGRKGLRREKTSSLTSSAKPASKSQANSQKTDGITNAAFGKLSKLIKPLKVIATAGLLIGVWGGAAVLCVASVWSQDLPKVDSLWTPNRPVSIQIVDRLGRDLTIRGADAGAPVDVEQLPAHVKQAVLSTEDRRFYKHVGVDPLGLIRAFFVNLRAGRVVQGGSTLTQQLSKNVFLSPDKTLKRKGQEMMLSLWLEHKFTKTEILNLYVNRVYFGNGTWGLRAASESYFEKDPKDLTLTEAALLAGVLKAPSRYNPLAHSERAAKRTARVLEGMAQHGVITREQQYAALIAPVEIKRRISEDSTNYFVDWIWETIDTVTGGLQADIVVQTTLDRDTQIAAHTALTTSLDPEKNATQGAVLTLDGTGAVRAMVGGRSYPESQFNRAAQALRQPGSAFKPFVYQTAFEHGYTPWEMTQDVAIQIGDWAPQNFTQKFLGPLTIQDAFKRSVNTVAVTLQEQVGRDNVVRTGERMGLTDLKPLRSLALGAQATTPLKLTAAYLPFANWGHTAAPYGVLSISTADGQVIYNHQTETPNRVLDSLVLGHMNQVLFNAVENGTGKQARIAGREIGGKTGTTNDFRDAWFIGFAPDLVTSVWIGSDDNSPMNRVTGGSIPARIFKATMETALIGHDFVPLPVSKRPMISDIPKDRRPQTLDSLLKDIEDSLP